MGATSPGDDALDAIGLMHWSMHHLNLERLCGFSGPLRPRRVALAGTATLRVSAEGVKILRDRIGGQ